MNYEATELRPGRWVVRPVGALGTCGWQDGKAWTAVFVPARTEREALARARCNHYRRET